MVSNISERRPRPGEFFRVGRIEPIAETISDPEVLQYLAIIDQHITATHAYPTIAEVMVRMTTTDSKHAWNVIHVLLEKQYIKKEIIQGTPTFFLTETGQQQLQK